MNSYFFIISASIFIFFTYYLKFKNKYKYKSNIVFTLFKYFKQILILVFVLKLNSVDTTQISLRIVQFL